MSDPAARFAEGQSVRAQVASLDAAKQRFTLSLKHSAVAASDAAYLRALLADLEAAEAIRCCKNLSCSLCSSGQSHAFYLLRSRCAVWVHACTHACAHACMHACRSHVGMMSRCLFGRCVCLGEIQQQSAFQQARCGGGRRCGGHRLGAAARGRASGRQRARREGVRHGVRPGRAPGRRRARHAAPGTLFSVMRARMHRFMHACMHFPISQT